MLVHRCAPLTLTLYDAPVLCACCGVGAPLATLGAAPRVDSDGQPVCEDCAKRLSRCKGKLHRHGPGHICHCCYTRASRPVSATATVAAATTAAAASLRSRKRRAQSDPGEPRPRTPSPRRTRPTTIRVTPPTPVAAQKKQRTTRQDDRIMRLLDETHARRMAASAASSTGAPAHS